MGSDAIDRIVILGAGQAGAWAAKTLRDSKFAGHITLVGDELHPPYERPPLSKAVLAGEVEAYTTYLFKPALLESLELDWRRGHAAVSIDRLNRRVELSDGNFVRYDRLILCMGGRPRNIEVAGASAVSVHLLRTIDDAIALRSALCTSRRLLVVGGGWLGLEIASTAHKLGLVVRVLEAMPHVCARVLPSSVSDYLRNLHQAHGVTISPSRTLARLDLAGDGSIAATLDDGSYEAVDCVVVGIGLIPNDDLARAAALRCDGGIVVDARCATSDPRIYAAGDVAIAHNDCSRGFVRLESWQNAQDQGIAAARAVLGQQISYQPIPKFWSDQYDVNIQIVGMPRSDHEVVFRGDVSSNRFLAFTLEGGHIRSAIAVNAAQWLRPARRLVESAARVDRMRLEDPASDLTTLGITR